jgi:hypothetical protein
VRTSATARARAPRRAHSTSACVVFIVPIQQGTNRFQDMMRIMGARLFVGGVSGMVKCCCTVRAQVR